MLADDILKYISYVSKFSEFIFHVKMLEMIPMKFQTLSAQKIKKNTIR